MVHSLGFRVLELMAASLIHRFGLRAIYRPMVRSRIWTKINLVGGWRVDRFVVDAVHG